MTPALPLPDPRRFKVAREGNIIGEGCLFPNKQVSYLARYTKQVNVHSESAFMARMTRIGARVIFLDP